VELEAYSPALEPVWEEVVEAAPMATLLHSRRFYAHHGDRFEDASLLIRDDRGRAVGVLPAAADPDETDRVTSHPGATYAGIAHTGALYGARMIETLEAIARHYAEAGFRTLRYKTVPRIYHVVPSDDDVYALFRLGASLFRCDLSCALALADRREPSTRRKRALKKAAGAGVEVEGGSALTKELWPIIEANLASRHNARPVHTLGEIDDLISRLPESVSVAGGRLDGELVAGVVLFKTRRVVHAQYIASSERGMDVNALDAVFESSIDEAGRAGVGYFDFGTSNREDGQVLNDGLYDFKVGFGGGGVAYECYDVPLG
jgi:CelD/BcsL family acetyltransferase involved in cellulose biosynthesis